MKFIPGIKRPKDAVGSELFFIFRERELMLVPDREGLSVPAGIDGCTGVDPASLVYFGSADGVHCYTGESTGPAAARPGAVFMDVRSAYGVIGENMFALAGRALHINDWNVGSVFCSRCGTRLGDREDERSRACGNCGSSYYPRISPAVMVAVTRGDTILLARGARFPAGRYGLVAGFVEPGESLEECAAREVMEETGISISGIRYYASRPWPFTGSLMVGFTADYAGGEIRVDGDEITEAGWFGASGLPDLPAVFSLARTMIDCFAENAGRGG
ncbi:MAG: NAD(+) diphosphatase [Spirochaetes bacterium]|jgi:NAD+ diphosphatase|nr:NAD(+) diphosphatase [Spirochaetota bacterium]